ncbi:MAG: Fe2+-dependent dioxygenase [Gammaproteobacteria bacterium]|nr:Fe2+-dependent dioxygenase [Gammaproteobacteria bacterium]
MLLKIPRVLSRQQLDSVRSALASANFVDGKLSAGRMAAAVKHNQEAEQLSQPVRQMNDLVIGTLSEHRTYRAAAFPARTSPAFFARYGPGMSYGYHVDEAVSRDNLNRSDIAITVFLSNNDEYEGGELAIQTPFGEQEIKLPAGDAVIYPASSLHRVREVTSGERLVAVAWAQSLIREPARRELLYELGLAWEQSSAAGGPSDTNERLQRLYANLLRMWADT